MITLTLFCQPTIERDVTVMLPGSIQGTSFFEHDTNDASIKAMIIFFMMIFLKPLIGRHLRGKQVLLNAYLITAPELCIYKFTNSCL